MIRPILLAVALCVSCAPGQLESGSVPAPALATLRVTLDGPRFVDAAGRTVTLRGVAAGGQWKRPPYFPFAFVESGLPEQASAPPFAQAANDFADLVAARGFNVVRLIFLWEALEPTKGTYDDTYLGRVATLAHDLGQRGIRVILDNHQDVYGTAFCGEGFPQWTLDGYSAQGPAGCSPWYEGYLGGVPDMSAAFDRLYANTNGVRDAFIAMWQHVAQRFASEKEVIAFEILNEPYRGTADETVWAAGALKSFFEDVGAAIRQEIPDALLVFEPSGSDPQDGMVHSVPPSGSGWIFGPHYYEPEAFVVGADVSTTWMNMTQLIAPLAKLETDWNLPVFFGEFGIQNNYMHTPDYLAASWRAFDAYGLSATAWHFSTTPDIPQEQMDLWANGTETPGLDACVRPYPAAIAGTLESFSFDRVTGVATLVVTATSGVSEIVVPTRRYPKGPHLTGNGAHARYQYDSGAQRLRFTTTGGGELTLTMRP